MGGHESLFESKLRTLSCHPSIEGNVVHTHALCSELNSKAVTQQDAESITADVPAHAQPGLLQTQNAKMLTCLAQPAMISSWSVSACETHQ